MELHPIASSLFPAMPEEEFAALKADIAANGLREAIWLHPDGRVIDGRHRLRACTELECEIRTKKWDGVGSLVTFVCSLNLHRRQLTTSQRAAIGVDVAAAFEVEAKERQKASGGDKKSDDAKTAKSVEANLPQPIDGEREPQARDAAAAVVGASARSIQDAKAVQEASPEIFEEVKAGTTTVNAAKKRIKTLCERCKRVGEQKDCAACKEARKPKPKKPKLTLSEQIDADMDEDPEEPVEETLEQIWKRRTSAIESWCRKVGALLKEMPTGDPWVETVKADVERKITLSLGTMRSVKCDRACSLCEGVGEYKGRCCTRCHGARVMPDSRGTK